MPSSTIAATPIRSDKGADARQILRSHLLGVRGLFNACDRILGRKTQLMALLHLAAASGGLAWVPAEGDPFAAEPARPLELMRPLVEAIDLAARDRAGRGALEDLPPSGEMIRTYLLDRPARMPIGHHRLRMLAELAVTTSDAGEDETTLRRLGIAIATGRREAALAALDARGRSSFAPPIALLAATGVVHLPGRRGRAVFAGSLDDPDEARAYAPSVPLLRDLLARGGAWRLAAESVLRELRGDEADEGRAVLVIADHPRAGRGCVIDRVRSIRSAERRRRALVTLAGAAIAAGNAGDAETIAAALPRGAQRERVLLAIASSNLDPAIRARAAGLLDPGGDPLLQAHAAIVRARLAAGEAKGEESPAWWGWVARRTPRPVPELPGEATADDLPLFLALIEARGAIGERKWSQDLSSLREPWLELADALPSSGEAFLDRLAAAQEAVLPRDPEAFLAALRDEPGLLVALVALTPHGAVTPSRCWSLAAWAKVVERLSHGIGGLAEGPLRRFQAEIHDGERVVSALLRGAAPSSALAHPIALDPVHSVRWLDKRRDFCAALRFADPLVNCFNSASACYLEAFEDTQRDVLSIWKDPLSFCFQVSRRRAIGGVEPFGFTFGSFGLTARGPVALLSGLYLRRQSPHLREAVLVALEEALCRPLGLRSLAVSVCSNTAGPLPERYRYAVRPVRRLRALEAPDGTPAIMPRDDLRIAVNVDTISGPNVHWCDLDA